jgi:hypothetical protein
MMKRARFWPGAFFVEHHSGAMPSIEPGISRFSDVQLHIVVQRCAMP